MIKSIQNFTWREAFPRIVADFAIVHLSIIGALIISVVWQTAQGNPAAARELTSDFAHYYTAFFWVLSPAFPWYFSSMVSIPTSAEAANARPGLSFGE